MSKKKRSEPTTSELRLASLREQERMGRQPSKEMVRAAEAAVVAEKRGRSAPGRS